MADAIIFGEEELLKSLPLIVARPSSNTQLSQLSDVVTLKEKINRVETTKEVSSNLSSDIIT
jgi:hypothetical protein